MSANYVCIPSADSDVTFTTSGTTYASSTSGTATYYPIQTWIDSNVTEPSVWHYQYPTDYQPATIVKEIIKEKGVTMDKRTLFAVYVVDPRKNGKILLDGKRVIAVNENQAMLKAGVAEVAEKEGLELEQVDVYVDCIGTFIRPRKETQRVKMVEKDEE